MHVEHRTLFLEQINNVETDSLHAKLEITRETNVTVVVGGGMWNTSRNFVNV